MVYFPCVTSEAKPQVVFRQLTLLDKPDPQREYIGFRSDDRASVYGELYVDTCVCEGPDSHTSVVSSISASPPRRGFLTSDILPSEEVSGASLGLATAVELVSPGEYSHVAFTGYLSNVQQSSCTFKVHDVDNVPTKIAGAIRQGVPLVVPYSEYVGNNFEALGMLTPKLVTEKPEIRQGSFRLATAYSLIEALCVAKYL